MVKRGRKERDLFVINKMSGQRGQATFDYLLLAGLIVIAVIPIFAWSTKTFSTSSNFERAQEAVDIAVGLGNVVGRYGTGYSKCVKVSIPDKAQKFSIVNGAVVLSVKDKTQVREFTGKSNSRVYGSIVAEPGRKTICAEKIHGFDGVLISDKDAGCGKDNMCNSACNIEDGTDPDCNNDVFSSIT